MWRSILGFTVAFPVVIEANGEAHGPGNWPALTLVT